MKKPLKVGDRVAVYRDGRRYVSGIQEIDDASYGESILVNISGELVWVHPNQCRRLIPASARCQMEETRYDAVGPCRDEECPKHGKRKEGAE